LEAIETRVQYRISGDEKAGAQSQYQLPIQASPKVRDQLADCPGVGL